MSYLRVNAKESAYSYEEIAREFGVSVHAVREAVRQLIRSGEPIEKHHALMSSPIGMKKQKRVFLSIKKVVRRAKVEVGTKTVVEVNDIMQRLAAEGKMVHLEGSTLVVEEYATEKVKTT